MKPLERLAQIAKRIAPASAPGDSSTQAANAEWFSGLNLITLDGTPIAAEALHDRAVLVVNVASKCGFTPQYTDLQALWTKYKDRGLTVLGAPCNQFGWQEPGDEAAIATFCSTKYSVDFPILKKQDVNGSDRSALFEYLVDSPVGAKNDVKWNFEKFLVGRDGRVLNRFRSRVKPTADEVVAAIDGALA